MSNSLQPHGPYSPWNSPGQNTGMGSHPPLQGTFPTQGSNPQIEPKSPALQADSSPAEPPGKPKNTGVDRISLLQQIFPTQGLNWGLCIASGFFTSWTKWELLPLNHLYYFPNLTDAKLEWLIQSHRALINQWYWEKRPGYLTPEFFLLHFPSNFQKNVQNTVHLIYANLKDKYVPISSLRKRVVG